MVITDFPTRGGVEAHEMLKNQQIMLQYLQSIYSSTYDSTNINWETFFNLRRTGELFSTKFQDYSVSTTGIGEPMNDSIGRKCIPSTDKVKNRDDFENCNAFWYTFCNFTVDDNGVKVPTAVEGQKEFTRTGEVDVGVLTPPLYWGEEKIEGGYIKHFSDSEHPAGHPELTLTLMPHCKSNKGQPMPYGIVPAYYAGKINGKMYSSSGLAVENFMSYSKLNTEMNTKGNGYTGAGSERSAYLKNFLWIKYQTLNSQKYFFGCTNYNVQEKLAVAGNIGDSFVTATKAVADKFYLGSTVSVGSKDTNSNKDRGQATMRDAADKAIITRIEYNGDSNAKIYLDLQLKVAVTTDSYISSMPLHSGQTDEVLGHDGYIANDWKHSFRIQGVEDGIGVYMVSSNEVMWKETTTKTNFYSRNFSDFSTDLETIKKWKLTGTFTNPHSDSADLWIGEEAIDLVTGASAVKTEGSGDQVGTGDRYYFGGAGTGLREHLSRAPLGGSSNAGLSALAGWLDLSAANWHFAACVS